MCTVGRSASGRSGYLFVALALARALLLAAGSLGERDRDVAREARVLRDERRFAASVRPPLSRWRCARTNGVTAWPLTPAAAAAASASSTSGSTSSSGSSGGRPSRSPAPPSRQCASATRAASSADSTRAETGGPPRGGVEEGSVSTRKPEHRDAERLEQLRGRGDVEERLHAGRDDERGRPRELREVGRDVRRIGKPRWTPPMPPVASTRIPSARATASVPPTVVAPTAPCATAAARSRGPTFRASASKRPSSSAVRPTRTSPSSTPTVAGTAPAARTCRSDSSPTATPSPGGKPWATSVVSSATTAPPGGECLAHLVGDPDHAERSISTKRLSSPRRTW